MAKASAPPGVPTPICRIGLVRAAISPSLRPKVAARRISAGTLPSEWAELSWGRRRQRVDPLVVVELLLRNISCVLSRKRKSPVAHLIERMSRPPNRRHLWPAPAKETMASRCSCRSAVGPGALIGDNLTWGNEAMPVLLRPCCLIALLASL